MPPPALPHGQHPDGDPFAEIDRRNQSNSRLGRMEARALMEDQQRQAQEQLQSQMNLLQSHASTSSPLNNTTPNHKSFSVAPPQSSRSSQRNSSRLQQSSNSKRREPDLVILSDSEDVVVPTPAVVAPPLAKSSSSSSSTSSGKKRAREVEIEHDHDQHNDATSNSTITDQPLRSSPSRPMEVNAKPPENQASNGTASATKADISHEASKSHLSTPVAAARLAGARESSLSSIATSPQRSPDSTDEASAAEVASRLNKAASERALSPELGTPIRPVQASSSTAANPNGSIAIENVPSPSHQMDVDEPVAAEAAQPEASTPKKSSPVVPKVARTPSPKPRKPPAATAVRLQYIIPPPGQPNTAMQVSVAEMAREAGYDQTRDEMGDDNSSDGEDDGSDNSDNEGAMKRSGGADAGNVAVKVNASITSKPEPPKRKRAPNTVLGRFGGYDVEDPFVDDTEANLYEPKFSALPRRSGYHICVGPVAVVTKNYRGRVAGSRNKPKSEHDGLPNSVPSGAIPAHPLQGANGAASASTSGSVAPKPPKKRVEIENLKAEVGKESFEVKNKFPPRLRPILVDVALRALELGEYDDDFFALMPKIFPYNLFTMKKLIKREIYPKRMALLEAEQARQIELIREGVDESLIPQKEAFAAAHATWREEKARWDEQRRLALASGSDGSANVLNPGFPSVAGVSSIPGSPGADSVAGNTEDGPIEPKFKFRFSEEMRFALYAACEAGDKMAELTVEKQELEKATEHGQKAHSAMNDRKILYNKIQALWPAGDMTSNQLSREMSAAKAKAQKQQQSAGSAVPR